MTDFETVKRQILDRVRIEDLVQEHVSLRRSGRRLVGLCPFHSEKTPSFTVNPELGLFKCFGCGKGGDVFSFVQQRESLSFMDALRLLADRAGVVVPTHSHPASSVDEGPSRTDILKTLAWAQGYFQSNLQNEGVGRTTRAYLADRGFTDDTVQRFGLGLAIDGSTTLRAAAARAGLTEALLLAADLVRQDDQGRSYDTFRHRVMFPIRDSSGRVIGFGGRTLGDDQAKYINSRQTALFDKGRTLYGIDAARDALTARRRAIIVEGYTDCIACHQAGFAETVATLGTALTEHHVDLLRRFADEIVLLFDSDAAGEAAADRAINLALPRCVKVRMARVPEGKDPSDYLARVGAAAFSDVLNGAIDALEFKWSVTRSRFRADASDAKRREAVLAFVRVVADAAGTRAVDAIQYGLLLNQIAHLLGIERAEVAKLMETHRPRRSTDAAKEGTETAQPAPNRAGRSAEQAAWTNVLEVLLSRPDLLRTVGPFPNAERITDDRDRRIAAALLVGVSETGERTLSDVLARCHEPGDAQRIAELVERGSQRGNQEATLRLALERLCRSADENRTERGRTELLGTPSPTLPPPDLGQAARVVADGAKEHRHFAPRRLRRQTTDVWAEIPGDATENTLATERP